MGLAQALVHDPEILILDEPINGLDPIGIAEVRDFIRELYAGYFITAVTRINNLAQRYEGGCEFPEVIITNYDPGERERLKPRQLDLFGMWGDGETDHYEIREEICPEREVL